MDGVVGPKTAILLGQYTFLIEPPFARFKTWNKEFIFKSQASIGYFSPVAGISGSKKLDYYIETYEELTGLNADFNSANFIYSVLSYDQVILVSEAIKSTKKKNLEVTSENIMSQLRLANFQGASGEISFENGSNDRLNMPVKVMKFLGKNDKDQMSFIPIASTDALTGRLKIITQ